jgi:hypothetical protein
MKHTCVLWVRKIKCDYLWWCNISFSGWQSKLFALKDQFVSRLRVLEDASSNIYLSPVYLCCLVFKKICTSVLCWYSNGISKERAKNVRVIHIALHVHLVSDVHFVIGKSGISLHFQVNGRWKFNRNTVILHGGNCAYKWPKEQSGYPASNMRSYG